MRPALALAAGFGLALGFGLELGHAAEVEGSLVVTFFYLWYGTPKADGDWMHWNHEVLPHWRQDVRDRFPSETVRWAPPGDLPSPYSPEGGPY
mmetsp:Transcript_45459/g.142427  ORF Transcript_45459/g.142427 Transcript_45459/m.142427 type:complete len:93 (-) Transcript_45459:38-316(-)